MRYDEAYNELVKKFTPLDGVGMCEVSVPTQHGDIRQTGRRYPCMVCGRRTGWRVSGYEHPAPVCSNECHEVFLRDQPDE